MRGFVFAVACWFGALVSSACLENPAVRCKGGVLCPPDTVCDDAHNGCTTPTQMSICAGKADETACSYLGVTDGACFDGVCLPRGCGNNVLDHGEACDDGNRLHGDGCSADCRSNEQCGNGFVDVSKGESCDDGNTTDGDGCQGDCKSASCGDGIVDVQFNEQCDMGAANSDAPNAECRKNCLLGGCGDGIIDDAKGETCDDSNQFSGDGCRFDCQSDESCGNGKLDPATGELCDDGNRGGQDGCASTCQLERAVWRQVDAQIPAERSYHSMVYDAARGTTLLFGGRALQANPNFGIPLGDTWTFDGARWNQLAPTAAPPARWSAAMAFNPVSRKVVLFGGDDDRTSGGLADTWEWDGVNWAQKFPTTTPPRAYNAVMAFDPISRKVLMCDQGTWAWNGADWTQVSADSTCAGSAMVFDAARNKLLLVGGSTLAWNGSTWADVGAASSPPGGGRAVFDAGHSLVVYRAADGTTWSWNGSAWAQTNPPNAPPGRGDSAMTYDAGRATIVLFGGDTGYSGPYFRDTWEWNGAAWNQWLPVASDPDAMEFMAMAYDSARARHVLFGGVGSDGIPRNGTWEWDGARWTLIPSAVSPTPRYEHAMAYDATRGNVVMFGGTTVTATANPYLNDTWTWDGTSWSQTAPTTSPPARRNAGMAFDSARGVVVLFGGTAPLASYPYVQYLTDTWEWNGTNWTLKNPTTKPTGCSNGWGSRCDLAYDANRSRMVLFDGSSTWEYDGTNWTAKTPVTKPGDRAYGALAYNSFTKRVVLFGGESSSPAGPWEWDGTNWVDKSPATNLYREHIAMTYDAVRKTLVMFGGIQNQYAYTNETWEWNGAAWLIRAPLSPQPRQTTATAYDSERRRVVLFGGDFNGGSTLLHDTWEWDGARWQRVANGQTPYCYDAFMAYDAARKRTLMVCDNQTWEWDGTTWTQRFPSMAVNAGPMAYDPVRKVVVLTLGTYEWDGTDWTNRGGGIYAYSNSIAYDTKRNKIVLYGVGTYSNETWEYDGTSWTQLQPAASPGERDGAVMAYDAARGTTILFGGGGDTATDTWEWDGTNWHMLLTDTAPSGRAYPAGAYDAARRELLLFGGGDEDHYVFHHDTWRFRFESVLGEDSCAAAIDGDGDGLKACKDPDCAGYCSPVTCGDGTCSVYENCRICSADCGGCTAACGDFQCDAPESATTCPNDCP